MSQQDDIKVSQNNRGPSVFKSFLIGLVLALLAREILLFTTRRSYPTHTAGAILVSGASQGIGRDAAIALAKQGFSVYAGVRKEMDAASLESEGFDNLIPIFLDVQNSSQIQEALVTVSSSGLQFVGLINNAGVLDRSFLESQSIEDIKWMYDVNVIGLIELSQAFLPLLRESKGRIVNMGSVASFLSVPGLAAYAGTKFALRGLSDGLRRELYALDVAVVLLEIGVVETRMARTPLRPPPAAAAAADDPAAAAVTAAYAPLARLFGREYATDWYTTRDTDRAVLAAMTDKRPRPSYTCAGAGPAPAWLIRRLVQLLPDHLLDFFLVGPVAKFVTRLIGRKS
uniref:Uncharacterized protein n=1 Tax=Heterosigma akashiwo TaxID=2829 RepID=A0A7S3XUA9_HETAK